MSNLRIGNCVLLLALGGLLFIADIAHSSDLDIIGVTALKAAQPSITGSGVSVIQAEAQVSSNAFEVNPATVGLPTGIFTYIGPSGSVSKTFTNSVGLESWHADNVGTVLAAVTPGISNLDNYDAGYYYNHVIAAGVAPASINSSLHNARIINQSFVFQGTPDLSIDRQYDSYASQYNVLFIDGAGNSGYPQSPSTAYNSISVNAQYMVPATQGPTTGGRSKPDLTAPQNVTSYAAPDVTGATALLLQAIQNNAGGANTATAAGDIRTMKALLLNGAVKPAGWSHTDTAPLDTLWGSGIVNVYNSYQELAAGRQNVSVASTASVSSATNLVLSSGWDLGALPDSSTTNHYFFTAPNVGVASDTLTATLDWNVSHWDVNNDAIFNHLFLALYDTSTTSSPVAISDSTVDNLQQLYFTGLTPGHTYDMRVYEPTATVGGGAETYGLAYGVSAGATLVPEPGTLMLLIVAGVCGAIAFYRRKR